MGTSLQVKNPETGTMKGDSNPPLQKGGLQCSLDADALLKSGKSLKIPASVFQSSVCRLLFTRPCKGLHHM